MIKSLKFFKIIFILIAFISLNFSVFAGDLLEKAFTQAKQQDMIIDLGNTKNAVGNEILQNGANFYTFVCVKDGKIIEDITKAKDCEKYNGEWKKIISAQREPLVVRITKLVLRITIALAITFTILNGILYMVESFKSDKVTNAKKNLINIGVGLMVALSSVMIINLIASLGRSSLDISKSDNVFDFYSVVEKTCNYQPDLSISSTFLYNISKDGLDTGNLLKDSEWKAFCVNPKQPITWPQEKIITIVKQIQQVNSELKANKTQLLTDLQLDLLEKFVCNTPGEWTQNTIKLLNQVVSAGNLEIKGEEKKCSSLGMINVVNNTRIIQTEDDYRDENGCEQGDERCDEQASTAGGIH